MDIIKTKDAEFSYSQLGKIEQFDDSSNIIVQEPIDGNILIIKTENKMTITIDNKKEIIIEQIRPISTNVEEGICNDKHIIIVRTNTNFILIFKSEKDSTHSIWIFT